MMDNFPLKKLKRICQTYFVVVRIQFKSKYFVRTSFFRYLISQTIDASQFQEMPAVSHKAIYRPPL